MAVVGLVIIHGFYDIPFRGNALMVGAAGVLLIFAYLSLGALFQLLTRNLATGLSLTSVVCSPAFGFAGVGFPVLAMSRLAQGWGALLPLRWYIQVLFDQARAACPRRPAPALRDARRPRPSLFRSRLAAASFHRTQACPGPEPAVDEPPYR